MKDRPILFSGPMVRAILSERKTQTRRVVKDCHLLGGPPEEALLKLCPYGEPGDRLWVRETYFEALKWRQAPLFAAAPDFIYRADYEYRDELRSVIGCHHWKPSIFMKREASRITLEIVSVRVELLQDISGIDASREGCPYHPKAEPTPDDVKTWYRDLWESINGAGSWSTNPWVWVVEFKKL